MKHRTRAFIAATGTVFFLSAAGAAYADGSSHAAVAAGHAPQAATATSQATVSTKSGPLGTVLVSSNGHTLYLFQADKSSTSTCNGNCAKQWPPLTVSNGKPTGANGVKANMLSTTTRSDGSKQVTYNGHPLYTFSGDSKAGQTNGQGLTAFGAKWYVVGTDGKQITKMPSSSTPSSGGGY